MGENLQIFRLCESVDKDAADLAEHTSGEIARSLRGEDQVKAVLPTFFRDQLDAVESESKFLEMGNSPEKVMSLVDYKNEWHRLEGALPRPFEKQAGKRVHNNLSKVPFDWDSRQVDVEHTLIRIAHELLERVDEGGMVLACPEYACEPRILEEGLDPKYQRNDVAERLVVSSTP